jgi:hypothetical protein
MAIMYAAYFDASGQPRGSAVLSVAGAASPIKKWMRFEREWGDALAAEGIKQFHATDFASSRKEFTSWKDDKIRRGTFLRTLLEIIKRNTNKLVMASLEIEAWNLVNQEYFLEENYQSPYAMCSCTLIRELKKWAKQKRIRSPVEYVFEDGDDGWDGLNKLCAREGVTPIRLPKEKAIPCQAVDLLAWKNRIACTNADAKLRKVQAASFPDWENVAGLFAELDSLKNVLVRPGKPGIYGRDALIRSCQQSGIAKRKS